MKLTAPLSFGIILAVFALHTMPVSAQTRSIRDSFYFEGEFDQSRVRFVGNTLIEVYHDCMNYASDSRIAHFVDNITIEGRTFSKFLGKWTPETVCAAAALNAKNEAAGEIIAQGSIEDLPFRVRRHPSTKFREIVDILIPALVSSFEVDRITLKNSEYTTLPGSYSTDTVRALILYNNKQSSGVYTAKGEAEGWLLTLPFHFSGNSAKEIQAQCREYFEMVQGDLFKIQKFQVNGRTFDRFGWNYWNAADVCMQIHTLFPR